MSMARLWRVQEQQTQAHKLLAPVHNRFFEGLETIDFQQPNSMQGRPGRGDTGAGGPGALWHRD
jgi:hypothetical protein